MIEVIIIFALIIGVVLYYLYTKHKTNTASGVNTIVSLPAPLKKIAQKVGLPNTYTAGQGASLFNLGNYQKGVF